MPPTAPAPCTSDANTYFYDDNWNREDLVEAVKDARGADVHTYKHGLGDKLWTDMANTFGGRTLDPTIHSAAYLRGYLNARRERRLPKYSIAKTMGRLNCNEKPHYQKKTNHQYRTMERSSSPMAGGPHPGGSTTRRTDDASLYAPDNVRGLQHSNHPGM